jgi:fructose-1,6-bisphosphatase I
MGQITTLDEFVIRRQRDFSYATGELTALLRDIGVAAKIVNREVNKAGLINILGKEQYSNVSGDEVQKLDIYANQRMIECLKNSGECAGIASEENEDFIPLPGVESKSAKYVVVFDPLDGSSNIDVNVTVGTIFGIYRRKTSSTIPCQLEDFLQSGAELAAAGYVIYGTSTILVYTTGNGVNGFTLDPSIGEFCLSHTNMRIPDSGKFYSVNQGYFKKFKPEVQAYINQCNEEKLRLRYIGSMVADVHRTLVYGGIFTYPETDDHPEGKLRLLYECNPLSMIVEQAGGKALDMNMGRILDIPVHDLHQRTGIIMGSPKMMDEAREIIERHR